MKFVFEQVVELAVDEVFAFHRDPHNLLIILQAWPALRLLHSDGGVEVGCRNWFEVDVFGFVPMVLGFEHVVYEPPRRFGERLIHGPFRQFTHYHEFEEHPQGTLIRDVVEVSLPRHYGGELGTRLLVAARVRRVFALRAAGYRRLGRVRRKDAIAEQPNCCSVGAHSRLNNVGRSPVI